MLLVRDACDKYHVFVLGAVNMDIANNVTLGVPHNGIPLHLFHLTYHMLLTPFAPLQPRVHSLRICGSFRLHFARSKEVPNHGQKEPLYAKI